jgi:CheY-like chemotaxis protein
MIIYQKTTAHWPAKHPDRELASASATDRRELLASTWMMAQGGETTDSEEPVRGSPPQAQQHGAPSPRSDTPQAAVLVVDDEEPVRETLVEVLSFHGYCVITAASVGEAEEAKQQPGVEGVHLVITDIHLTPGRQIRAGYALAQHWRAAHPGLPVILISGDPSNQDLPDVQAGAMQFLLKPFRMEAFLEVVREALGR